ncbi:MAG: endonuclease/exonuclease/phosphatase family protein [Clostridia bacterium]|nr:endonuclease/exonuclease/phosphatase family protein [Clostridia bacterium]
MNKTVKKIVIPVLAVFLALLLVVIGYLAYVIIDYDRIEDYQTLDVEGTSDALVETGTTYTILTQNVGFGAYTADFTFFMDGGTQSRAESEESVKTCISKTGEILSSYNPDFVLIQEVDFDSTRSYHVNQKDMLAQTFASYTSVFAVNYHSSYLMFPLSEPHGASNSGLLTLSKNKISSSIRRSLPISTGFSKFLDLDRCFSVTRLPVENGKELVLYNVHMSAYGGSDEIRAAQMGMLFQDMLSEYEKGNYCVCGGDFNHDFTGNSIEALNPSSDNSAAESFGWAQPFPVDLMPEKGISRAMDYTCGEQRETCRNCDIPYEKGNFVIIVDGFLVSDNVKVEYLENVQLAFAYSDHNPVLMKFVLE